MDDPKTMSDEAEKHLDGLTETEKRIARRLLRDMKECLPEHMTEATMADANLDRLADAVGSCFVGGMKFMGSELADTLKRLRKSRPNPNNN